MGGLREKKKKEAYEKILEAGKTIFATQGYDKTTMEQLAEKAGIGVGTIYNYFKTKADVFLSIMEADMDMNDITFHPDMTSMETGVREVVWQFIGRYLKRINRIHKRFLNEILFAVMSSMKSDSHFLHKIASMDYRYIARLGELMDTLKAKGLLQPSFDSESAAMVIYSIILTQTMIYAMSKDISYGQFESAVKTQIAFTLRGKTNGKEENSECLSQ